MADERVLFTGAEMAALVGRMADRIAGSWPHDSLLLVGLERRGVPIAKRLAARVRARTGKEPDVASVDINLYSDKLEEVGASPVVKSIGVPPELDGRRVVIVDDVLFTGRTVVAALSALMPRGKGATFHLAVLIDRGHRAYPVEAEIVGARVFTTSNQIVKVMLNETDREEGVRLLTT